MKLLLSAMIVVSPIALAGCFSTVEDCGLEPCVELGEGILPAAHPIHLEARGCRSSEVHILVPVQALDVEPPEGHVTFLHKSGDAEIVYGFVECADVAVGTRQVSHAAMSSAALYVLPENDPDAVPARYRFAWTADASITPALRVLGWDVSAHELLVLDTDTGITTTTWRWRLVTGTTDLLVESIGRSIDDRHPMERRIVEIVGAEACRMDGRMTALSFQPPDHRSALLTVEGAWPGTSQSGSYGASAFVDTYTEATLVLHPDPTCSTNR